MYQERAMRQKVPTDQFPRFWIVSCVWRICGFFDQLQNFGHTRFLPSLTLDCEGTSFSLVGASGEVAESLKGVSHGGFKYVFCNSRLSGLFLSWVLWPQPVRVCSLSQPRLLQLLYLLSGLFICPGKRIKVQFQCCGILIIEIFFPWVTTECQWSYQYSMSIWGRIGIDTE